MLKMMSFSTLIIICLAMIETTILSNIMFLPAIPDMVLLAAVYVAMMNGRSFGVVIGFISGLILDWMTGSPFGYNCLLRTIICYGAGFFCGTLNFKGFFIPVLIGLGATFLKVFITWLMTLFYPNTVLNYNIISMNFFFELLFNSILCPVIFKILSCFDKHLSLKNSREF